MVTAKCSMGTTTILAKQREDFWFEGEFYIEDGAPLTIADFESTFFEGHAGVRLMLSNNSLQVENKFGAKLTYEQDPNNRIQFPLQTWVTVKAHFIFDDEQGIIQVWQDDDLIIDAIGKNIPIDAWMLNSLEFGISATQEGATLLVDNLRFSDTPF